MDLRQIDLNLLVAFDALMAGFGVALMRLKLGASWLDAGRLVRLSPRTVPSHFHHYLCWKPGVADRWECAAFIEWFTNEMRQLAE